MTEGPIKFVAKQNCKHCYARGFITRTQPLAKNAKGEKQMSKHKTLCHCVTEIKTPEPDECVVPKVAKEGIAVTPIKQYASTAQPLH